MVDTGPTTSTAGSTPTAAVMDRPRERTVINAGGVVADDGTLR